MSTSTKHLDLVLGTDDIDPARIAAQTEWKLLELNRRFALANWGGHGTSGKQITIVFERDEQGVVMHMRDVEAFTKHPELLGRTVAFVEERIVKGQTTRVVNHRPLAPYWVNYPYATKYDRLVFAPPGSPEVVRPKSENTLGDYQLWHGLAVTPNANAGEWTKTHAFIRDVICAGNEEHEAWLHNWIAAMVQKPGQHAWVAPMLLSGQGTGKGFFVSTVLAKLFREENYLHLQNSKHLTTDFNAFLTCRVLVFADEAVWADKASANLLKTKITEDRLMINPKHLPHEIQLSCLHIIIASNSPEPVHIEHDDRRYFVLRVAEARKKNVGYFAALERELDNGGRAAMLDYFMNYEVDWDALRTAPDTKAKEAIKAASLDPETEWWQEVLTDVAEWQTRKLREPLHTSYLNWLKAQGRRGKAMNPTHLGRWLHAHFERGGMAGWPKEARGPKPQQERQWVFPSLDQCREAFEVATGTRGEWEDPAA